MSTSQRLLVAIGQQGNQNTQEKFCKHTETINLRHQVSFSLLALGHNTDLSLTAAALLWKENYVRTNNPLHQVQVSTNLY